MGNEGGAGRINPVVGTNNPIEGKPGRDRVLSDAELKLVWQHCLDDDFGRVVRLLLLTACRRDEIGGLRWPEVDLQRSRLLLPAERTKPGRALELPLVSTARAILEEAPKRLGREFVFGGSVSGFSAWSWCKLIMDGRITTAQGGRCLAGPCTTCAGRYARECQSLALSRTSLSWC